MKYEIKKAERTRLQSGGPIGAGSMYVTTYETVYEVYEDGTYIGCYASEAFAEEVVKKLKSNIRRVKQK